MLKILYLIPPKDNGRWVMREHKEGGYDIPYIPQLVMYVLGLIQSEMDDVRIKVLDAQLEDIRNEEVERRCAEFVPDVIIAQMSSYNIPNDKKYMELGYPTICISPESFDPVEISQQYDIRAKYFVKSEIENTVLTGIKEFQEYGQIQNSPGFIIREDTRLLDTGESRPCDLSELPRPAYNLLDIERYFKLQEREVGYRCAFLYTTRGCTFNCKFCSSDEERKVRSRKISQIMDELRFYYREYQCRNFNFCDSTFSYNKKRTNELCEEIAKTNLHINFVINDSINTVDEEMIYVLKKAGCRLIRFGIETGDEKILKEMEKSVNKVKAKKVFDAARRNSIKTDAFLMVGLPGETPGSLRATSRFVSDINPDRFTVSILHPKPFSRLYLELKEKGMILEKDWSKYLTPERLTFKHDTYNSIDEIYNAKWWLVKRLSRGLAIKRFKESGKNINDIFSLFISYLKTVPFITSLVLLICKKSVVLRRIAYSAGDYDRMYTLFEGARVGFNEKR